MQFLKSEKKGSLKRLNKNEQITKQTVNRIKENFFSRKERQWQAKSEMLLFMKAEKRK